jgi:hypothetical protein
MGLFLALPFQAEEDVRPRRPRVWHEEVRSCVHGDAPWMKRRFSLMKRFCKFLPAMAVLGAALVLATPTPVRADYAVEVYDDGTLYKDTNHGGPIGVLVIGNSLIFTGSTAHFDITNGSGASNNPGSQGGSTLSLSSNEQIDPTFGAAGGTHKIEILLSQDGWTAPVGSTLILSSSAGGSMAHNFSGTNLTPTLTVVSTYQGFLDNTDTLFGTPVAGSTPIQTASATLTSPGTAPLVYSPGTSQNVTVPGGTPFSMTDDLTFKFTLDAGSGPDSANASASTVAYLPGPAGFGLALAALPCLGIGQWLRRRKRKVA